ncbi:LysR substrate-binding domain-containing protein [Pusillimonas sp. SM2304]|uniref:LysR substrate-binding domain-containing protein n=1 Tax=Pusillimonas sp. SM2304 TaxID=3073241 RepID=UPI0028769A56|nr:LysR substrate-binding domain-containing protein [Pusillimonas sp. SM2304]MDS1141640.1 LysR substrate-binding domain-containing protein [Pusillimonas sp. SM2304]
MNLARFDLVTLSLFIAIAREGSISAGARRSHLAIGAASKRISDLEVALGTPLLYRHAGGVELTEAGQAFLHHSLRVVHEMEQMASALSDYAFGVKGHVRLGANTSAITQFLSDDLAAFMREHPAIQISLKEENSTHIVNAVINNQADLGIFADRTPCAGLTTYHYRYDELVLIVPRHHPLSASQQVSFADTLAYDYIGLSEKTSLAMRLKEESERLGKPLKLRIQVRGFDSICRMAIATQCIGILPRLAAATHARSMALSLIPLTDEWARRKLLIGVRDPDALTAAARLLLAHVQDQPAS